ncbi:MULTISPECIES: TRAP transporter substrate-binding protein [unclassified Halomonas]|uniref:TRAP transporter substrate-binding protein n=1 Tax=Halomonas sp. RT37 TaxID=2950872 RepID=A0AAU7KBT8_9GAMM|nr:MULTISPECIES: TRAP transporter substrate-binding protein [unclassified Halomonas]MBR9772965.1 TRAP transporter substrate-binding protein [Gammaproteobacteria bacterium]KJZ06119.1 C4-dicarboxylate ABC transporter substrate-binding protein [Halomonas sp. S2151]MBY5942167.1 TRAP transporter substrate-binding protein [Halomonas sp. DP5N14-9]MCO7218055.1 TRAP transporter substrate-binding protein [Halomonas sp. OfavH-34-E]USZ48059.1 TRAP transporter substrate-binding protein [Halomonas sp. DN3]|tara:strand:- start:353 stop:1387 length:1035 start_codon:yes stop_codon:yes gene_type:complete
MRAIPRLSRLAASIGAASIAITAAASAQAAEYEWTFQASETAGEPSFKIKQEWAERIETMTDGRVAIEVLPINSVVGPTETLQAVSSGILQGHMTDPSYFSGQNPAFGMLGNLVGAWNDPYDFLEFMNNAGGEDLYNELVEPYGAHLVAAATFPLESIPSTVAIESLEDFEGLKIRAPQGMVYNIFERIGATPVNLPGSEVYTGLEKGVIDAADSTVLSNNDAQGLHAFAPYPLYPGFHSMPMIAVSVNKDIWDGLPEDLQTTLETAFDAMAYDLIARLKAQDIEALARLQEDPEVHPFDLPDEERKAFRQAAEQEWQEWAGKNEMTQKVYDAATGFLTARGQL